MRMTLLRGLLLVREVVSRLYWRRVTPRPNLPVNWELLPLTFEIDWFTEGGITLVKVDKKIPGEAPPKGQP